MAAKRRKKRKKDEMVWYRSLEPENDIKIAFCFFLCLLRFFAAIPICLTTRI